MKPEFSVEQHPVGMRTFMKLRASFPRHPLSTAEALEWSIEKWRFIEENIDTNVGFSDGGDSTCALCHRFLSTNCIGCPVSQLSGQTSCLNTPYEDFVAYKRKLLKRGGRKRAMAERKFLEGLRDIAKGLDDGSIKPSEGAEEEKEDC